MFVYIHLHDLPVVLSQIQAKKQELFMFTSSQCKIGVFDMLSSNPKTSTQRTSVEISHVMPSYRLL